MGRIGNVLIAAFGLIATGAAAQTPDVIEEIGGHRFGFSRVGGKTLGAVVGCADEIFVWRIKSCNQKEGKVRFECVKSLKTQQRPAGAAPEMTEIIPQSGALPSWCEPGREAVVFIRAGMATACFGTHWREFQFAGDERVWKADQSVNNSLRSFYTGSTDNLVGHVRAILAGREVVVTAVKMDPDQNACASVDPNRIWRIKTSLKIDAPPRTIRSPLYVGWGAGEPSDLPRMVARLTHPQWWMRSLAIRDIASLGDKAQSAIPELSKRFCDERPLIRIEAAEAIMRIEPDSDLPLLAIALELRNPDRDIRDRAATSLGRWKKRISSLLPWMLACFENQQAPFCYRTVMLLGELGANAKPELKREIALVIARKIRAANSVHCTENTLALLLTDLAEQAEGVQSTRRTPLNIRSDEIDSLFHVVAAKALLELGPDCAPAFPTFKLMVRAGSSGSDLAGRGLLQFAPDGPAWLVKQLGANMPPDKAAIVAAFHEIPEKSMVAIPALRKMLTDKDDQTKISAARALLAIDRAVEGGRAVRVLLEIAANEKSFFRDWAREYAQYEGFSRPELSTRDGRRYQRYRIMQNIRDPSAKDRWRDLHQLEAMGSEATEVVPELWRLMEQEKTSDQLYLLRALAKIDVPIERGGLIRDSRQRLVEKLRTLFRDETYELEELARTAMLIGPMAAPLLDEIWCCLGNGNEQVRWCAIGAIANIGPPAAKTIPDLRRIADEDNPFLQEEAIVALCRVSRGSPEAVQRLREWCLTQDPGIISKMTPADLGNETITPILLSIIEHDDLYGHALTLLEATDAQAAKKLKRR
jgi:HEAT repeat protein